MAVEFIGDRIRRMRGSRSREEVCRHANIDPTTLRRAETMGHITLLTARKLAPVLGVKANELDPRDRRVEAAAEYRDMMRKTKGSK
jgi:hypothetical protein